VVIPAVIIGAAVLAASTANARYYAQAHDRLC